MFDRDWAKQEVKRLDNEVGKNLCAMAALNEQRAAIRKEQGLLRASIHAGDHVTAGTVLVYRHRGNVVLAKVAERSDDMGTIFGHLLTKQGEWSKTDFTMWDTQIIRLATDKEIADRAVDMTYGSTQTVDNDRSGAAITQEQIAAAAETTRNHPGKKENDNE